MYLILDNEDLKRRIIICSNLSKLIDVNEEVEWEEDDDERNFITGKRFDVTCVFR